MSIVAIDRGRKTIGLAYQGKTSIIMPLGTLTNDPDALRSLAGIIAQKAPSVIVIGLPAQERAIKASIKKFGAMLQSIVDPEITLHYINEDYSSVQAGAITGVYTKDHSTDTLAAMTILQNYLDTLA